MNAARRLNAKHEMLGMDNSITPKLIFDTISQWWMIAAPVGLVLAVAAGFYIFWSYVPMYEAQAVLQIQPPQGIIFQDGSSGQYVNDQIAFLKDEMVMDAALSRIPASEQTNSIRNAADPVSSLANGFSVRSVGRSSYYTLSYMGVDPIFSKTFVNAVSDAFQELRGDREKQYRNAKQDILARLEREEKDNVTRLKDEILKLTKKYVASGGTVTGSDSGVTNIEMEQASPIMMELGRPPELARAEGQLASVDFRVLFLQRQIDHFKELAGKDAPASEEEIQQAIEVDPRVTDLLQAIDELKLKIAGYERTGKNIESHPSYQGHVSRVERFEADLATTRAELRDEYAKEIAEWSRQNHWNNISALEQELELLKLSRNVVNDQYVEELANVENVVSDSLVRFGFVRSELARSEQVLTLISDEILKLELQGELPSVREFRKARTPTKPTGTGPTKKVLMFAVPLFFLPFGLALLWEWKLKRVNDLGSIKDTAKLPIVGEIATLPGRHRAFSADGNEGLWLFEESVDSLRTGLTLSEDMQGVTAIAVTSACSQEGKTSISAQFALSLSKATGKRTLIVDGDMRAPDLHIVFDTGDDVGLADVLEEKCTPEEAIVPTFSENLDLLPAGQLKSSPHRLVGNGVLASLITKLKEQYSYIVIDTPPILSAAEALVMAKAADVSLVCAMRNVSRVDQVRNAFDRLTKADARPVGIVLNGVPVRRYAYAYGKYSYRG